MYNDHCKQIVNKVNTMNTKQNLLLLRKLKVKQYIEHISTEYLDYKTGEFNFTEIAEVCAAQFNLYEKDGTTIIEDLFDLVANTLG